MNLFIIWVHTYWTVSCSGCQCHAHLPSMCGGQVCHLLFLLMGPLPLQPNTNTVQPLELPLKLNWPICMKHWMNSWAWLFTHSNSRLLWIHLLYEFIHIEPFSFSDCQRYAHHPSICGWQVCHLLFLLMGPPSLQPNTITVQPVELKLHPPPPLNWIGQND